MGRYVFDWNCDRCQFHNFSFRRACLRCKMPRHVSDSLKRRREGTPWICTFCDVFNWSKNIKCFKCKRHRGFASGFHRFPVLPLPRTPYSRRNYYRKPRRCDHQFSGEVLQSVCVVQNNVHINVVKSLACAEKDSEEKKELSSEVKDLPECSPRSSTCEEILQPRPQTADQENSVSTVRERSVRSWSVCSGLRGSVIVDVEGPDFTIEDQHFGGLKTKRRRKRRGLRSFFSHLFG